MKTFVVAKVLVVNNLGELLLLRRSQSDERRPGEWDIPGGWVEDGEDILAAALRETQEEAGLKVDNARLVFAITEPVEPEYGSGTWVVFMEKVYDRPPVTLSDEHDHYTWMPMKAALEEVKYHRQKKMIQYVIDNGIFGDDD